jgi:hypothetical protein
MLLKLARQSLNNEENRGWGRFLLPTEHTEGSIVSIPPAYGRGRTPKSAWVDNGVFRGFWVFREHSSYKGQDARTAKYAEYAKEKKKSFEQEETEGTEIHAMFSLYPNVQSPTGTIPTETPVPRTNQSFKTLLPPV